jgi:hypothetical protein
MKKKNQNKTGNMTFPKSQHSLITEAEDTEMVELQRI